MTSIVCYDIADNRRRDRLAEALKDFGRRIQESVFWVHLDDELYQRMTERIGKEIDIASDTVHIIPVCAACEAKVEILGQAIRPSEEQFYIV